MMSTKTAAIQYSLDFGQITIDDLSRVGGKNASLGELFRAVRPKGVNVLDGFATTTSAFSRFLEANELKEKLDSVLSGFDPGDTAELQRRGKRARDLMLDAPLPADLRSDIEQAYNRLIGRLGHETDLAVRSSATAEDLPEASFAGAAETYLNIQGLNELLDGIRNCFASLYTDRAISYRAEMGFDQLKAVLCVGVQPMVRSDLAASGVIFTLDTESGFRDVIEITSSYGLGEFIVQGEVTPDEWRVFKPTLRDDLKPIISRRLGTKEVRMIHGQGIRTTRCEDVPQEDRRRFSISDDEVLTLARWACLVEGHYSSIAGRAQAMDIEWAKDGITRELYILQARPETVHSQRDLRLTYETYRFKSKPPAPLVTGQAVGERIGIGKVRLVSDTTDLPKVETGEVLVARNTNPDWEPVMRRVAAVVTDSGGRTAHAAIVSRELGLPCIVGCGDATKRLKAGDVVTVSAAEGSLGRVYPGEVPFEIEHTDISDIPKTRTKLMCNVADPDRAFAAAMMPNDGVGLARIEFIISNHIGIHPMALANFPKLSDANAVETIASAIGDEEPKMFFVRKLSEGIAQIAAAFYPKPVIVRTSDFKTNEYRKLIGGAEFEPDEENPMIGFRGASRYYDERYRAGFALECDAIRCVREEMGLTNVKVMIPFCRTPEEAKKVVNEMKGNSLVQGENGLEIYGMCEVPSNVIRARDFLQVFDGYSIGSNDLTQLTLGIDRDSSTIAGLFDEDDSAVRDLIAAAISAAHEVKKPVGICGQAPSDKPEFAAWLVGLRIDSISLNPDSIMRTRNVVSAAEEGTVNGSLVDRAGRPQFPVSED